MIFVTTTNQVTKGEKLLQLQRQKEHNYRHHQEELTTIVFLLIPFFKGEKKNYGLFLCNRLNELQI